MRRLRKFFALALLMAGTAGPAYAANEEALALIAAAPGDEAAAVAVPDPPVPAAPSASKSQALPQPQAIAPVAAEEPADPPKGPWHMPQPRILEHLGIHTGGWLEQGISWGPGGADRFNGPVSTNDRDGEYMLNQFWMYFVRPTKTDGDGFDIGGRIDLCYGEDWRFGQNYGLETRIDDPNSFYGLVLPQFYGEVAYDDLTVKLGHFATMTSYEVVPAPLNFFYSHTLLSSGYFDPLLVTGVEADYKLNDNITLVGGFNRGWMMFEDLNGALDFLGGAKWASDDKKLTVQAMVDTGPQDPIGHNQRTEVMCYATWQITERLLYATQHDAGSEVHGSASRPGHDASWYGMDHWLIYKINPKWQAGARFEWVADNDGSRVWGIGNVLGTDRGWNGKPGCAGSYYDLTLGLNYRPHPNFVFRPEVRWDWYGGTPNSLGQLPFNDHTDRNQFLYCMDLIATF